MLRSKAKPISIRVSPGAYFGVLLFASFLTAFLLYLGLEISAAVVFVGAWLIVPVLAFCDRIVFDGRRLRRTGLAFRLVSRAFGVRDRLKLSDVEQVDSQTIRTIKRGGRVTYRYRTSFHGKGVVFSINSGGEAYRRLVRAVLPNLSGDTMDARSIELRDYLAEPDEVLKKAQRSRIPPSDVLENSLADLHPRRSNTAVPKFRGDSEADPTEIEDLRRLGNELRLTGSLLRAIEAFRRALLLAPRDAWLLYDLARCLLSYSGAERDERLERRAVAMIRLAERRAGGDGELLARIGESYFQIGDWRRAASVFKTAIGAVGESFRSLRGLAEIALREGKIAHVIHNFAAANRLADTSSLRRWTLAEMEYFSRLNEDDEYMELEVSRVNLLDTLDRVRRSALRFVLLGLPVIAAGLLLEDSLIANIGWGVSILALCIWILVVAGKQMLQRRIPFEIVDADRR
jgi:tetratricopeptide (TPR) repeat protein